MVKRAQSSKAWQAQAPGFPFGRHFRLVTTATSVSRVTGYLRDTLNANLFGAGLDLRRLFYGGPHTKPHEGLIR